MLLSFCLSLPYVFVTRERTGVKNKIRVNVSRSWTIGAAIIFSLQKSNVKVIYDVRDLQNT